MSKTVGGRRRFGSVRRLPSGMWQAFHYRPDGKRHVAPTTFQTKGDAEAWLAMEQTRIIEQRWKPPAPPVVPRITLGDYAEKWLGGRELKPRTRSEYRRILDLRILPTLGQEPLSGLTAALVRSWYADLDREHPRAKGHAYGLLHVILNSAVEDELIAANVCRIRGAMGSKRRHQIRPATPGELATIVENMPPRFRLMVLLAAWCALRYGELAELRRSDIDLRGGVIKVQRGVTWPNGGKAVVGTPKSSSGVRDVHIPPHLVEVIKGHIEAYAQPGPRGLLFPNANGDQIHHGSTYQHYKRARRVAGRDDLRWHDLRHSGAVWVAQSGATVRELMDRLGHSTPSMALHYQHVSEGRQAELARKLSEMITGPVS